MNYLQYYPVDVVNGEGTRCTLFVAGCTHACRGCYNQASWRFDAGLPFDEAMEQRIIDDLNDTRIRRQGLSLSGGDPLHPRNVTALLPFVRKVKALCPEKDIWLWTGYRFAEFSPEQRALVDYVDVLIDGKFEQAQADRTLRWRGSRNQVIYYLKV
ncbi:anaerobic ribonucleoside-triphosphate reductase-activating protein [Pasteurellaceae bacterium HPA106]|uniref:anaerobic ribonucleoside-triphosphate reductase-activating protein n=1 Tax=Spirabiliibacterium pneumoniae TaxID=221400 RepID=UPI001AAC93AD|nr:anaerobic ribonucleoside-triphosphate reductase-activating protein [Spirabiliibacterium pneumoniae]MBE2897022.1 anaerobic ribonucleoside-triphosphate reductase-activating protein [Spirabiliibacterium pneumoniae]